MEQVVIFVTSLSAVILSQSALDRHRKYACVFGLLGQPFWFYTTYQAGQWGIFICCFAYTFAWLQGVKTHWDVWK